MLWILLEALVALLLLCGIVAWVMLPQKKGRNTDDVAPIPPPAKEEMPPARED